MVVEESRNAGSAAAAGTALRTVSTLMRMRTTRPKSAQIYTSSRLPALHIIVTDFEVLWYLNWHLGGRDDKVNFTLFVN